MYREEIREQASVQQIDGDGAAGHIGPALPLVTREHVGPSNIQLVTPRIGDDLGDGGGVAQPEIEALRADRRHDMRGFAYECDTLAGKGTGRLDRKRKNAAPRFNT